MSLKHVFVGLLIAGAAPSLVAAQGTVRGAEEGANRGGAEAGPVGAVVGGAVGAATGTVNGVLGRNPNAGCSSEKTTRTDAGGDTTTVKRTDCP